MRPATAVAMHEPPRAVFSPADVRDAEVVSPARACPPLAGVTRRCRVRQAPAPPLCRPGSSVRSRSSPRRGPGLSGAESPGLSSFRPLRPDLRL